VANFGSTWTSLNYKAQMNPNMGYMSEYLNNGTPVSVLDNSLKWTVALTVYTLGLFYLHSAILKTSSSSAALICIRSALIIDL